MHRNPAKQVHVAKNKWVAVILNLIVWGSGYIYLGRKGGFGTGLIIVEILEHLPILLMGLGAFLLWPLLLFPISHTLISILLAYDAYAESIRN